MNVHRAVSVTLPCMALLLLSVLPATAQAQSQATAQSAQTRAAIAELKQRGLYPSLQQAIQNTLYRPEHEKYGGYDLYNPAQRFDADLTVQGLTLRTGNAASVGRLCLVGIGHGSHLAPIAATTPEVSGERVHYHHGSVTEWYENTPSGIEQGFTLASRPTGSARRSYIRIRALCRTTCGDRPSPTAPL